MKVWNNYCIYQNIPNFFLFNPLKTENGFSAASSTANSANLD